ncbi:Serine hydrolase (FSH1)-like protein 2 [Elsinoe fawcettii]|nr:Serine hydrolase (FSH1)-like protein 2 [Elsinoe fawcettii]
MQGQTPQRLPRILCFHGAGSNADIFACQARLLRKQLKSQFEFVFVDAPFEQGPGPGIVPAFQDSGPFYGWLPPSPTRPGLEHEIEIMKLLETVLEKPENEPVIGVMGFSQGCRIAGGLLLRQQRLQKLREDNPPGVRFGILFMGAGEMCFPADLPLVSAMPRLLDHWAKDLSKSWGERAELVTIPTLHVQGMQDPIFPHCKEMARICFDSSSTSEVVVAAGHHMPTKPDDIKRCCEEIQRLHCPTKTSPSEG